MAAAAPNGTVRNNITTSPKAHLLIDLRNDDHVLPG
jgi:hypothetical protein